MMNYFFNDIFNIYILWFVFLYIVPILTFLKLNTIETELIELKGLKLTPRLLDGNVISVSSNYNHFIKTNPKLSISNVIVKLFINICIDAENGKPYNPNLYISNYKATLRKFVLWILLLCHIPISYILITTNYQFHIVLVYQIFSYILIYILEMILQYKIANFIKVFYMNWYNQIMNFDLLSIKLIRNDVEQIQKLSNSKDLLKVVNKFEEINTTLNNNLISHTDMLSSKMDKFINLQQRMNGINSQNILLSLDDTISKYKEMNTHFQEIAENIRGSFDSISSISKCRTEEINAINKNSELILDIRERFKNYQSETLKTELTQLQNITSSLDNNVNKAFESIINVISQNFKRLEDGYDKFFDICKLFGNTMSDNFEEKTASALDLLFKKFQSEFSEMRKQTEKSLEIIEATSSTTELLCKSVYDFNQYIMNPSFMNKINNYANFSKSLKNATERLISYEQLTSLIDTKVQKFKNANDNNSKEE